MIVGEYRNQTTSVLFTYPIKRRKLIAAKLIVILAFTFGVILFSDILLGSILVAADRYHPFVEDSLAMKQVQSMLNAYVVSSLSAAAMALIPLAFSMRKHSVTATMVSSVLLVLIVCSGFDGPLVSIDAALAIQLTLGVAGLAIAWLSMLRLETNDVN
ncbi:ABC transporter permease [Cohnella ginsengisoli]|uniref:ABC transporter permease n=1 Tax=Cohnella ginsengisoli TaxID=425004 RepID=A0A9X4QQA3_9BACL|nr:ABC transporter permease [Cohnella ginsengisoli]MDG0794392.1 ABC transporter permease [Cohnella ginsengisoli]